MPAKNGQQKKPWILMSIRRKYLGINFKAAAKKRRELVIPVFLGGKKRRIRVIVESHTLLPDGERVVMKLLSTHLLNRPHVDLWIPTEKSGPAGILMPAA